MDRNDKEETPAFQVVDKRHFADLDQIDTGTVPAEQPRYPSYVEELRTRMAETERKFQEKKQQIDDEINRTRTRLESDFERKVEREKQKIILPFLEVLDNLQRAVDAATQTGSIDHLLEGVRMTADLFRSKLQAMGVEAIDALNQPFDPNLEQAVGMVKVEDPCRDGVVVEELQSGYSMNGQLLRPAQVRVGKAD
ncbi:MAG: GrpE protein [Acidobacteria bacterium]|nr:GrpE protein [Acidobacteriota bacterium]